MNRGKLTSVSSSTSLGGGGVSGRNSASSASDGTSSRISSSPPPKKRENFFDMPEDNKMDIWSPGFANDLRRSSTDHVAGTVMEDTSVERVGGAYIDEERLRFPVKRRTPASIPSETDGSRFSRTSSGSGSAVPTHPRALSMGAAPAGESHQQKPAVRRLDLEYDRVKELEGKVEKLESARWCPPSIHEVMNRLLLGKPVSLSWFKSMEEKKQLLDAAVATNDGNCIMAVVLYIKRTVNEFIFLNVLERRPVAIQHYINFLKQLRKWKELKALYERLNQMETLVYFYVQEFEKAGMTPSDRVALIKSFPKRYEKYLHKNDWEQIMEYSRLIHMQQNIEKESHSSRGGSGKLNEGTILFQPLTSTLLFCCRHYRGEERKTGNPEELRKVFGISDNQFFQMDLLALALRRDWKAIDGLVTTKGVLGIGKKKKSPIGFERIIRLLGQGRYRAPDNVLIGYLKEIDDLEARYSLAVEVGLYVAALDALVELRDRERVKNFINSVPPKLHYEIRGKIERALDNSQIKWK